MQKKGLESIAEDESWWSCDEVIGQSHLGWISFEAHHSLRWSIRTNPFELIGLIAPGLTKCYELRKPEGY